MSSAHQQFVDMIPWWVNGRIDDADRVAFDEHLQHCEECRREIAGQQRIFRSMTDEPRVEYAPGASLQSLLTRINDASGTPSTTQRRTNRPAPSNWTRWLVAATLVEAVGLVALASTLLSDGRYMSVNRDGVNKDANYRTVTTVTALPSASLRVVFSPTMTLNELGKLLQDLQLEVVAGPSRAGVYSLALTGNETLANELAALRARPDVRFAEPIAESPNERSAASNK